MNSTIMVVQIQLQENFTSLQNYAGSNIGNKV